MGRTLRLWSAGIMFVLALAGCGSTRPVAKTSAPPRAVRGTAIHATVPSLLALNDIAMVTSEDGWGIASGAVVVTVDGGRNWRNVTPPGFPKTSARLLSLGSLVSAFPTAHDGIIAQKQASTIRIWRTMDGGVKWQVVTWKAPESVRLRDFFEGSLLMRFRNVNDGLLILGAPGNPGSSSDTLLTTIDGGRHWHLLHMTQKISAPYLGPSPSVQLADVVGLSLSPSGWGMASIDTVIWGRAWVITTTNGGQSWLSGTVPLPAGSALNSVYEGPQAVQGNAGAWLADIPH